MKLVKMAKFGLKVWLQNIKMVWLELAKYLLLQFSKLSF